MHSQKAPSRAKGALFEGLFDPFGTLRGRFAALLLLTLAVAFTPALGAGRRAVRGSGQRVQTTPAVTIKLTDYGAVGDGVTDDGPALQKALEALAAAGGGTLFVPDGHYSIASPVSVNFSGRANAIEIEGTPSSAPGGDPTDYGRGLNLTAEIVIRVGPTQDALTLQGLDTLSLHDLVLIGDLTANDDARVVLNLSGINDTEIRRCEFYGLASFGYGGAILYAAGGGLRVTDSAFLGCAGNSGNLNSIVQIYNWKAISITGTRFIDYGDRPDYYSKTTYMSPYSWVSIGGAAHLTNVSPRRDIVVSDVFFDEGAYVALSVRPEVYAVPDGGAVSMVFLSKLFVNVTNIGGIGVYVSQANDFFIENSHLGWSHYNTGAVFLSNVRNGVISQSEFVASANKISADSSVAELSVINSIYTTLDSQAPITRVITTANPQDGPVQYVNQKYLDVLGHPPDIPARVYWSEQRARCNDDTQCTTDEELLNYLNGNPATNFSISGKLLDSERSPIAGATVSLGGAHAIDTLSDANGNYLFSGLATAGEYTITPSRAFYTFNANGGAPGSASRSFITPGGDQTADFTGTLATYSIRGRVNDWHVQAMPGVTVSVTGGPDGFEGPTSTTNGTGDYFLTALPAGYSYSITASKNFYNFDPPAQTTALAGDMVNLNFVGTPETHSISGQVTDGVDPLSGATVTLSGASYMTTTTDADGNFSFAEVVAGENYVVTVTKQHYTFTNRNINGLVSDQTVDFIGQIMRFAISGGVTVGGNGLGGATIKLDGDQTATVVSNSGSFQFIVDAGGSYSLTVSKKGYSFTPARVNFDDLDQNVFASFTGRQLPVLLTANETTNRAIALNSITMQTEPFNLTTPFNFSNDGRTRIVLFARLLSETPSLIIAQAKDSEGHVYPLDVEYRGLLPDAVGITQLNLRLNDWIPPNVDLEVTITANGLTSDPVLVRID